MTFTVGEEVLYHGERYVIAQKSDTEPYHYRLLATTKRGAKFVWANVKDLQKIDAYTRARLD